METSRAYSIPTNVYYPTTYYYPITFRSSAIVDAAVMPTLYARTTSTRCCGEMVDTPIVRDLPASSEPAWSTVAASSAARTDHREQPPVRSEQAEDDSIPSNVPELPTPQLPRRREQSTVRSTPSAPTAAKPAAQGQGDDLDTVTDPKSTTRPGLPVSAAPAPGAEVPRPVAPTEGEKLGRPPIKRHLARVASGETRKGPC